MKKKNALRYSAGYVTRSVKKEIAKSSHPLKDDIVWCIDDMTGCDEDLDIDSSDWITLIDRGGLTCVNNITFELFQVMEIEFHEHLKLPLPENFRSIVASAIVNNEDVLFFWDIISTEWEEEVSRILINKIIEKWVTIRGFLSASSWLEKYKKATKTSTQKSKGIRKKLI